MFLKPKIIPLIWQLLDINNVLFSNIVKAVDESMKSDEIVSIDYFETFSDKVQTKFLDLEMNVSTILL